jgi:dipeptidyl aminopeptidase/acylaminoacyl peptidase
MWMRVIVGSLLVIGSFGAYKIYSSRNSSLVISPLGKIIEKPLDKYTIHALSNKIFSSSPIILDEPTATTSAYTAYTFHYYADKAKVTGIAHIPNSALKNPPVGGKFPVIVQLRGYVDREKYFPGEGTSHSAQVYARNGFITLAPDFLGYGGSDMPSNDVFEERFQTYTSVLTLLSSISTLPMADSTRVGIWGHSNGGQIALTVNEILHLSIPTALWAPVSKPFPYSILYYTDDITDHGKALRLVLSKFEKEYDAELYSLTNYLDRIAGPLLIHQGERDESVPQKWTDDMVRVLKEKNVEHTYYVYPGVDHNMLGGWKTVVSRDVEFFKKYLK